ncbi:hypothetical protein [Aureimonas sp. Leaf454]|uniref:hypothetical protein n=1 Tax=Aureimonas sp. Leaf454 TaxID=1736381 RepID=UPI0012E3786D|nr:hypothetical protein [Aureimonas sp. Leaf454]
MLIVHLRSVGRLFRLARHLLGEKTGSTAAEFGIIAGLLAASIAASLGMMAHDFTAAFQQFFGSVS